MKAASLLKTRNNKIHLALAFDQSEWLKPCIQFNKRTEAEKNKHKDGKVLYKLMNNTIYGKAMENVRNKIDIKLGNNTKKLFKMYIKTKLYVTQNILH